MTYLASSCFNFKTLKDLLSYCRQNGFYQLELGGNLQEGNLNQPDFSFLIHNYFPAPKEPFVINLASTDEDISQKSLNHCFAAMSLCHSLEIPFYSVHAGFLVNLRPNDLGAAQTHRPRIDRATGLKNFTDAINQLLETNTIDLLIENNVNSRENLVNGKNELYLLAEPEETLSFFKQINHPRLGLLVDLGHLNVSAEQLHFNKYQYLKKLAPWIKAFHLSANNGLEDQGLSFTNNEWFIEILKKFPAVPKIIEINKQNKLADLLNCLNIINNL